MSDYGSFSSPGFPSSYSNNLRCIWTISVKPERTLTLKFDDFSVEDDITCRFDFLLVKKSSQSGLELGKFCGSIKPRFIRVNGNKVWMLFKSDDSVGKKGFRVIWSSEPNGGYVPTTSPKVTTRAARTRVTEVSRETPVAPETPIPTTEGEL